MGINEYSQPAAREKMTTLLPEDIYKRIFLNENARISIKISLKFVPRGPINNTRSHCVWTNDGMFYWCIYASLGLSESRWVSDGFLVVYCWEYKKCYFRPMSYSKWTFKFRFPVCLGFFYHWTNQSFGFICIYSSLRSRVQCDLCLINAYKFISYLTGYWMFMQIRKLMKLINPSLASFVCMWGRAWSSLCRLMPWHIIVLGRQ